MPKLSEGVRTSEVNMRRLLRGFLGLGESSVVNSTLGSGPSLDCNEYLALMRRRGKDYSKGHRIMYEVPIVALTGQRRRILEAGFGIGWGLERMLRADIVETYVGYEPNIDSFNYVIQQHGNKPHSVL